MINLVDFIEEQFEEMKYSGELIEPFKIYLAQTMIEKLREKPVDLNIKKLDKHRYKEEISEVLSEFPFEELNSNFDENILVWIWSNIRYSDKKDLFLKEMKNHLQFDVISLNNALFSTMLELKGVISNSVLSTYNLIEYTKSVQDKINIEEIIDRNIIIDCDSKKRMEIINSFNVIPLYWMDGKFDRLFHNFLDLKTGNLYDLFLDGPSGIALTYDCLPCALTSYYSPDENTMMIVQFQGVRPKINKKTINALGKEIFIEEELSSTRKLNYISWDKVLFEIDEEISRTVNFSKMGIISAKNHAFYGKDFFGKIHMDEEIGYRRYDMFAEKMNFKQRKDGNWYKHIK